MRALLFVCWFASVSAQHYRQLIHKVSVSPNILKRARPDSFSTSRPNAGRGHGHCTDTVFGVIDDTNYMPSLTLDELGEADQVRVCLFAKHTALPQLRCSSLSLLPPFLKGHRQCISRKSHACVSITCTLDSLYLHLCSRAHVVGGYLRVLLWRWIGVLSFFSCGLTRAAAATPLCVEALVKNTAACPHVPKYSLTNNTDSGAGPICEGECVQDPCRGRTGQPCGNREAAGHPRVPVCHHIPRGKLGGGTEGVYVRVFAGLR